MRQVELGFRVAGRLKTMTFEEGQPIATGTVLASLDTRPFEDELRIANADVASADANLKKLIAGNRPPGIARAEAAVEEASAAQKNASVSLERSQKLVDDGAIPALPDSTTRSPRARGGRTSRVGERHVRLIVQGTERKTSRPAAPRSSRPQARLASAETALDDARLLAPSDGIVISRVREPGAIVSPNDIVYVVSLTHSVWVRAYVSGAALAKVHLGMKVEHSLRRALRRTLVGHVGFVSPTAEFTPKTVETPELRTDLVYRLRIIVDDSDVRTSAGACRSRCRSIRRET